MFYDICLPNLFIYHVLACSLHIMKIFLLSMFSNVLCMASEEIELSELIPICIVKTTPNNI